MFDLSHVISDKPKVFRSPHSLEECVQKLIERSERDTTLPWYRQMPDHLLVSVKQIDLDMYQFKMQKHVSDAGPPNTRSGGFYVELTGSLERSQSETIVRSQARVGTFTRRFAAIWLTGWITLSSCGILSGIAGTSDVFWISLLTLVIGVSVMSLLWKWAIDARNKFSHLPNEILGILPT